MQVGLFGPKLVKVIVPVGLEPPLRVDESEMGLPIVTEPEAVVTIDGEACDTVDVSPGALQGPATEALLASPLYVAIHR